MLVDVRADRLVATLLLLQRRGRVTAAEVARELEVSERTARRDLDALAVAGVPLYSSQGRGGGWRLVGGARTDLSGLTATEARALFLVAGPAAPATPAVRTALRKLVHALPATFRDEAEVAAAAQVTDADGWDGPAPPDPPGALDDLRDAVVRRVQVHLGYVDAQGCATARTVHPLGVVAKGRAWYLVAGTDAGRRTFRVDRVTSVEPTGDPTQHPPDFDLAAVWREITDEVELRRSPAQATAWCTADGLVVLRRAFGSRLAVGAPADDGRTEVVVRGRDPQVLAGELAALVAWVEVTGPPEVRTHLATLGATLVERYGAGVVTPTTPDREEWSDR